MQAKAEVNSKDRYGDTPLHNAAGSGHIDCVNRLLEVCIAYALALHCLLFPLLIKSTLLPHRQLHFM